MLSYEGMELRDERKRINLHLESSRARLWMLTLVLAVGALYAARLLQRGWVPFDEGALAQSAERCLHGELPHREFDEIYTGGLSYLNAASFKVFGENLASPRYVLYAFLLVWIPAVYFVASRFSSGAVASAVTLLAVAWSVPNYSAALPSWYNLFFATFGGAALMRYIEVDRPLWIFFAGLCGGISFLFKLSGLYFIAGVLLFFLFKNQTTLGGLPLSRVAAVLWRIFTWVSVTAYSGLFLAVVGKDFSAGGLLYLVAPTLAIGIAILRREWTSNPDRASVGRFWRELLLFSAGVAFPVALFLVPYALSGSLAKFYYGVFVLPGKRFAYISQHPPLIRLLHGAVLDVAFVMAAFRAAPKVKKVVGTALLVVTPVLVALARAETAVYRAEWGAIWMVLPVTVVFGVALLIRLPDRISPRNQQRIFLLLSVCASCSLIQFPYGAAIYFVYVAPLALLAATALIYVAKTHSKRLLVAAYCFCLLYVTFDVTPGFLYQMGDKYSRNKQTARLNLPRAGGLRVLPASAQEYEALASILSSHMRGDYIYATPDCPEVYFLAGRLNPTRTLFDFLDSAENRTARILSAIHAHDVRLVVLNRDPYFSGPVPSDLRTALENEFPNRADTAQFEVRWKP